VEGFGLNSKKLKELEGILPEYLSKRNKGMHVGMIAEKLGLPLKDVMSFLIEKNVLRNEEVDLELTRVILHKNPNFRRSVVKRVGLSFKSLDYALATQNEKLLEEVRMHIAIEEVYYLFPKFVIFICIMSLPYGIALNVCMALFVFLLIEVLKKGMPKSSLQTVVKMLRGV